MEKEFYKFHGVVLPRPVYGGKFSLYAGKNHIEDTREGALKLKWIVSIFDKIRILPKRKRDLMVEKYPVLNDIYRFSDKKYPYYIVRFKHVFDKKDICSWLNF